MADKSWMLNAKAIAAAKKCISIVEVELGVRLKLSHPDFLELLVDYADLNESSQLQHAILVLAQYAPTNIQNSLAPSAKGNIINLEDKGVVLPKVSASAPLRNNDEPRVHYKGKVYPRYRDGYEFKGLYRGQPRYA